MAAFTIFTDSCHSVKSGLIHNAEFNLIFYIVVSNMQLRILPKYCKILLIAPTATSYPRNDVQFLGIPRNDCTSFLLII